MQFIERALGRSQVCFSHIYTCFGGGALAGCVVHILLRANVSKGTIYAYFPSKDKLFEALIFQDRRTQAERALVISDEGMAIDHVLHELGLRLVKLATAPESIAYVRMVVRAVEKFPKIGQAFFEAGLVFGVARLA